MKLAYLLPLGLVVATGCGMLPEVIHQPTVHNPFPQLARVAVAPFFNLSNEPTLDTRLVANAYFNELQSVPGFEVVPIGVVETALRQNRISLNGPADARRLAQILQVDAVIIGAVTDYTPYYPPRMGMQVEWYAANPGFHPVPPGYGLPWGTPEEQQIPQPLIFEAEFALARQQMKTQTPDAGMLPATGAGAADPQAKPVSAQTVSQPSPAESPDKSAKSADSPQSAPPAPGRPQLGPAVTAVAAAGEPTYWPDPRGFVPPPPRATPPTCWPSEAPVLRHTRVYNGNDADFTQALAGYYALQDEGRFDGWRGYLQRSDDFVRFCCHMHIWEMLTARGGAGETRVVWRWPTIR